MSQKSSLALILAAGMGTRMKSVEPKVLHRVAGAPMLAHVVRASREAGMDRVAVIIAPGQERVAEALNGSGGQVEFFTQEQQLGTAHAALAARSALERTNGEIMVLVGDAPLVRAETLQGVRAALKSGVDIVVLGFEAQDPTGYGRLLTDGDGQVVAIREEKDASAAERKVTLCNSGVFGFRGEVLLPLLNRVGCDNAKGEYYLTDVIEIARRDGLRTAALRADQGEVIGVNSRKELAEAEGVMQQRLRQAAMDAGVTMIAPGTVFLSHDTKLGKDVVIEPNVVFGPGVVVEDGVTIKAFSHIEGARLRKGCIVGPFARLRPGADIGVDVHIGNFVEIKNARIDQGAKANHLAYIGDAEVGAKANIGAGAITCNYDGFGKYKTIIGAGAFIGSNSALVAPVKIGEGAYIGSGSVISKEVPADALALTRGPLEVREGWAAKVRLRRVRDKKK